MNKVLVFYGSNNAFSKIYPSNHRNLTDVVLEMDEDTRSFNLFVDRTNKKAEKEKVKIKNFVIHSDEYSGVKEHVLINFVNFISNFDIENMYIQNPPVHITEQLHRLFDKTNILEERTQEYKRVTTQTIIDINKEYDSVIIGQNNAKMHVLEALYPLTKQVNNKPRIILFYGNSGIGKTETANFIAKLLNGKPMRKQFSMFQNNQFSTYLFGGTNNEGSFAKDLLDRDSNIILLDEFDKANPVFHSAFYQLFDEGIYEDKNYRVILKDAIIICTSNYQSKEEIISNLGSAIYNRFDSVIHFEDLSVESKLKIYDKVLCECSEKYSESPPLDADQLERLKTSAIKCSNVRAIKRLVENTMALNAVKNLSDGTE